MTSPIPDLPELPVGARMYIGLGGVRREGIYTADQMQAYGLQCYRLAVADRDRLAAEVESLQKIHREWLAANSPGGWIDDLRKAIKEHNEGCNSACNARRAAGKTSCYMLGYDRDCGDLPREKHTKEVDERAIRLYEALEDIFEGVRSTNEDMRREAERQIADLQDRITDLEHDLESQE